MTKNVLETILVLGATGTLGRPVAHSLMSYFEKVGERGDPAEANRILGAPAITLDMWLARRKGTT